ncbi:DUF397 domain-containing protein [Streptomyces justiciae]|uniref:DUF397 domain-containing protein n=1 Tax=Streptomyces justiciae TaxID=2780140 RepID=UPI0021176763|nr:DUF397 domain-containing protein [Streptomyces justiciae]MCW8375444.1 DUF397 domain-containing protein [Streptomyces justiciae]
MTALVWFKSSYSSNEGPECVEVAISPADANTTVHVRDSKDADGAQLAFTRRSWVAFIGARSV